jgi:Fe2+ transport system protein FeoA
MKHLSELKTGESAIIKQLCGGREFTSRVAALGFTLGTRITVLQNFGSGPVIIGLRDTRVALGRGEAIKILVIVENGEQAS